MNLDSVVHKTVPLPLARLPGNVRGTPEERAARVQAHMDRVHPMVDAIRREEAEAALRPPIERKRKNDRKFRARQLVKAQQRAAAIAGRRT